MQFSFSGTTIQVNIPDRQTLLSKVGERFRSGQGFALATINLDHLVKLGKDDEFAKVYAAQDFVVADGRPIVWLSRLAKQPVELLPGSDLVGPLALVAAAEGVPVALIGSTTQALEDAKASLESDTPGIKIVYCEAPPFGFETDGELAATILKKLNEAEVGLCFLALGAPKQESLAVLGRQICPRVGFASIGAGLDFLGGHQVRAPRWVRALALEWVWRALSDPVRLVPRYLLCLAILPRQVQQALRLRREQK